MENSTLTPDFDAWLQNVILVKTDGSTIELNLAAFDWFRMYTARIAINYGTQVGASIILLTVLLLLTRSEKRKSCLFITNALCLMVNIIRMVLCCCFTTSTIWNPFTQLTNNYAQVTERDLATAAAADVFAFLLSILIMVSLSLQVWVVCITTVPVQRYIIMGVTGLVACVAVGFRAAFTIINIRETSHHRTIEAYPILVPATAISQAVSICVYSCVFTYKLGHAIMQRRKLKMTQFGPMQVVFIMGCQTMFIPALVSTLQFNTSVQEAVPDLGMQVLTVTCIFLPLSAIWAGVVNETVVATRNKDSHHRLIQNEFYRTAPNSTYGSTSSNTMVDKSRQMSVCTCSMNVKLVDSAASSPMTRKHSAVGSLDERILVNREFGISRDDAAHLV